MEKPIVGMAFRANYLVRFTMALAAVLFVAGGFAFAAISPDEEWFLMYKEDIPIGYTHARVTPLPAPQAPHPAPRASHPAPRASQKQAEPQLVEMVSDIWIRIGVNDKVVNSSIKSKEIATEKFRLVSSSFEWNIGDVKITIESTVEEKKLRYTRTQGKSVKKKEVEYPYGCIPLGMLTLLLKEMNLSDPVAREFCVLDPQPEGVRMSRLVIPKNAVRKEPEGGGKKTFKVKMELDGVPIVYRIDEEGTVLEAIQPTLGFVQRRVDRSVIPRVEDLPVWNLLETTATPAPEVIPDPENLRKLRVMLEWSDIKLSLDAASQKVEKLEKRGRWFEALVSIERFHATASALTEISPAPFSTQSPLLRHTPIISSASPLIAEKTAEALEGATTTYGMVERLSEWIYANIDPDPRSWNTVTTADEIITERIGMNKHYSILFAAMARAAGIPTKICAGKSYNFGFFVDHYWNEVLIGGSWMPVDATTPSLSPPPLNIKLAEGSATEEVGGVLSRLRPVLYIDIVDAR